MSDASAAVAPDAGAAAVVDGVFSPPPFLNRFRKTPHLLGEGACKAVFEAIDLDNGRSVAWNEVFTAHLAAAQRLQVEAEVALLRSVQHPNIVDFLASWASRDRVVFVTEIVESGDLQRFYRTHRIRLRVIKKWCRQILSALTYLHSRQPPIVHRDVKCENILYNAGDGTVKIGDLGLSAFVVGEGEGAVGGIDSVGIGTGSRSGEDSSLHPQSEPQRGTGGEDLLGYAVLGTPNYMAPEQYEGQCDTAVDVYAFGMCVLEMVTGLMPYAECSNAAQIYKRVSSGQLPEAFARIRFPCIQEFVLYCLRPGPGGRRPAAAQVLAHPFLDECAHAAEDDEVDLVRPHPRPRRRPGRRRAAAAKAVAVVAAAASALAEGALGDGSEATVPASKQTAAPVAATSTREVEEIEEAAGADSDDDDSSDEDDDDDNEGDGDEYEASADDAELLIAGFRLGISRSALVGSGGVGCSGGGTAGAGAVNAPAPGCAPGEPSSLPDTVAPIVAAEKVYGGIASDCEDNEDEDGDDYLAQFGGISGDGDDGEGSIGSCDDLSSVDDIGWEAGPVPPPAPNPPDDDDDIGATVLSSSFTELAYYSPAPAKPLELVLEQDSVSAEGQTVVNRASITFDFDRQGAEGAATARELVSHLVSVQSLRVEDHQLVPFLAALLETQRFAFRVSISSAVEGTRLVLGPA